MGRELEEPVHISLSWSGHARILPHCRRGHARVALRVALVALVTRDLAGACPIFAVASAAGLPAGRFAIVVVAARRRALRPAPVPIVEPFAWPVRRATGRRGRQVEAAREPLERHGAPALRHHAVAERRGRCHDEDPVRGRGPPGLIAASETRSRIMSSPDRLPE